MKTHIMLAGVMLASSVASLRAQTVDEVGTYVALSRTPVGALGPIMTNTLLNRLQNGASLSLRYGNLASGDFNATAHAFGVTGILPAGLGSSIRLTAGAVKSDCNGCNTDLMLSLGGDVRLTGMSMGNTSTSPLFTVSLDGELGYGRSDPAHFVSGYVGLPIALVQRGSGGMQFVPFLTPAFAFAQSSNTGVLGDNSTSGTALMLGGGLGIYNMMTNVNVNVGAQHSFMNGARNTIGINVTVGGK